jgi:hypothetical protein
MDYTIYNRDGYELTTISTITKQPNPPKIINKFTRNNDESFTGFISPTEKNVVAFDIDESRCHIIPYELMLEQNKLQISFIVTTTETTRTINCPIKTSTDDINKLKTDSV